MFDKTLKQLATGLEQGEFSSVEITEAYLDRIDSLDTQLNCFISTTPELALQQAKAADERRAQGNAAALTGVPIAQKDIFCTKGVRTTCASKMLDNFVAPYDATVISQCNEAGMVMLGKTNMDEFAMGSTCENSFYGATKSPWDLERIPGGSSGGSAAAVAARLAPAATGTDTGGSIRQPASHTCITGIKPTYGRVSRYGMIAFASSLDQGGPMTQTAEDAAMLLNAMAGFDPKDSTCVDEPVPDYTANLNDSIKGLRIGLPKEFFAEGIDPQVEKTVQQALEVLTAQGAELVDISLPNTHLAVPTYYIIAPAEASSNLARYDGVRYGHRCENPVDLEDLYKRSRGEGFGDEVKRRIIIGTYTLSAGYYDAYYLKAQQVRRLIANDYVEALKQVDVIAGPTTPHTAFRIGETTGDPLKSYLSDVYTISVNLAGLPSMSIPAGFSNDMPVGLQLIGNYFDEAKLLNVGHQFQQQTDWHKQIPQQFSN